MQYYSVHADNTAQGVKS